MNKKLLPLFSVLIMSVFSLCFVSCDDNADDDLEGKTMQITNGSNQTLYSFTVIFGDVEKNIMSQAEKGDLYPGDKTTVRVPVGAYLFFLAYYNKEKGEWLYSPVYTIGYKTLKLDNYGVSQWSAE